MSRQSMVTEGRRMKAVSSGWASPAMRARRAAMQPAADWSVHVCIPDDQLANIPSGMAIPAWPAGATLPRTGDVVYLTSTSAWGVMLVIHELVPGGVRVEVWLEFVAESRHHRSAEIRSIQ